MGGVSDVIIDLSVGVVAAAALAWSIGLNDVRDSLEPALVIATKQRNLRIDPLIGR